METGLQIDIVRYQPEQRARWDSFIRRACNGSFLLSRTFMEHHPFPVLDHSVGCWKRNELIAVLPAHEEAGAWHSHRYLSHAGLIWRIGTGLSVASACWKALLQYGLAQGWRTLYYTPVPSFYHIQPCHLDALPLHWLHAECQATEGNILVDGYFPHAWQARRRRGVSKALRAGLDVRQNNAWDVFWEVLSDNLQTQHQTAPVHDLSSIAQLHSAFPDQIALYTVWRGSDLLGGTVLFKHPRAWHAQYIASTPEGRQLGALDLLFSQILQGLPNQAPLSLGVSTIRATQQINQGLLEWKESWGGRVWPQQHYSINLKACGQMEKRFIHKKH